ncbi:MAG: alpha/beta fold hydrolase [Rhizomicrobium sp.]
MIALTFLGLALVLGIGAIITAIGARRIAAANPPAGRFVPVNGGRLHVVELGANNNDEPAIVLIHGASGNLEDMRPLGELLAARRHVVMVDRPGHGWSDRPGGPSDASPERQAQLIAEALASLGIARVVVVGHSLGGTVAAAFALAYPQRASGLVLLAAVTHPWPGGIAWYLTSTRWIGALFAWTLALPLGMLLVPPGIASVFAPDVPSPDYARRTKVALFLRPAEFIDNAADVAALYPFVVRQSPHYGELAMPVGILSGDTDSIVSIDIHSRAMAKAVEGSRLIILPNGGHMPHQSATAVAASLVEEVAGEGRARPGNRDFPPSAEGQPCGGSKDPASPF